MPAGEREKVRKTFHVVILSSSFFFLELAGGSGVPLPYPPLSIFLAAYQRRVCAREIASLLFLPFSCRRPRVGGI